MCRIGALPERRKAYPAHGIDETLVLLAQFAIGLDDPLEGRGDLVLCDGRPDDLTERSESVGRASEADLVPLLPVLVDAEDADVTDVMMATGVHATGHLDLDLAEVVEVVEIIEALLDLARDRDRPRVGERAEIQPGAGDHVGERADVGHRKAKCRELLPEPVKRTLRHIGEQQVLRMRAAHQAKADTLCQIGQAVHLRSGHVARYRPVRLEGYQYGAIAGYAMRPRVVAIPGLERGLTPDRWIRVRERLVRLRGEEPPHALDLSRHQLRGVGAARSPFALDFVAEALDAQ